jgi:hypothetical protein
MRCAVKFESAAAERSVEYLATFYEILDRLREKQGGGRVLRECSGRMNWPERGVYFIFEPGEVRHLPLSGERVVRVGTHALKAGSRTTLWNRLSNHRGRTSGAGNHRGSVFRLHVGMALMNRDPTRYSLTTWDLREGGSRDVRDEERELEYAVSEHIGRMTAVWLPVADEPGPDSLRGVVERNAIALLAGRSEQLPTPEWLGRHSARDAIRKSGLWNVNYVDDPFDPVFLDHLARLEELAKP